MMNLFARSLGILHICTLTPVFVLFLANLSYSQEDAYYNLRQRMVRTQIQARGITDKKILDAFRKVERHRFVLPEHLEYAYYDSPLPIREGQTISQPYIVAYMTDALRLKPCDKVLEIGTGSGYQAAILAELCDSVFTIEIFKSLTISAQAVFSSLGYKNIYCMTGDGYKGWPEHAPFDAIIVTCSPTHIPLPLKNQLTEGGRMIIPVGRYPVQSLVLLEKRNGMIREREILPVRFVPMLDNEGKEY